MTGTTTIDRHDNDRGGNDRGNSHGGFGGMMGGGA